MTFHDSKATRSRLGFAGAWALTALGGGLSAVLSLPARAVDVVQEINHACAVNGGCFAGDAAGYPITIAASGSYRLTSNLTMPDEDTSGIVLGANHIDLDLNGFVVSGPVACSGTPLVCTPSLGNGSGIDGSVRDDVRVRNGVVRGAGNAGIFLQDEAIVENVRVRSNAIAGIRVSENSRVSASISFQNGRVGISVARESVVSECVSSRNGWTGIDLNGGDDTASVVSASSIFQNELGGVDGEFQGVDRAAATVTSNAVYDNGGAGINLTGGLGGNVISGNVVVSSGETGLLAGSSSITDNTIAASGGLEVDASTGFLGGNSCDGTTTCP